MSIDTSRRGFLGGIAATLLVTSAGVKLAVPTPKPLLAANGWPICNGQRLVRADYRALFEVIDRFYGCSNDDHHFRVPDLGQRHIPSLIGVDYAISPGGDEPAGAIFAFAMFEQPLETFTINIPVDK